MLLRLFPTFSSRHRNYSHSRKLPLRIQPESAAAPPENPSTSAEMMPALRPELRAGAVANVRFDNSYTSYLPHAGGKVAVPMLVPPCGGPV